MSARTYTADGLDIEWYPERCIHTARCVAAAPDVFDPQRRPWITPEAATSDEIMAAVEACPTGALRYRRADGGAEEPADPTEVFPVQNGPLAVRGPLRVLAEDGTSFTEETRLTFCRCGHSGNQPFCDNSHRRVTFESRTPVPAADRPEVDAPDEICPPQDEDFA